MKIIVSSDRSKIFNSENIDFLEVLPSIVSEEREAEFYSIYLGVTELSRHRKKDRAITELNKLAVTLSTGSDNLLYYMEDTN